MLTRKIGEGIAIGDDVKIVVMQVKGKQVRLGIKANPKTIVHREEIYQKILDENSLAAKLQTASITALEQTVMPKNIGLNLGNVPFKTKGSTNS